MPAPVVAIRGLAAPCLKTKMEKSDHQLSDRMRLLIDQRYDKRGKFAQLEALSGVAADNWKSFYYGRQRPNADMVEALAQLWPECAFWLVTGINDFEHGHTQPTFNNEQHGRKPRRERTAARELFLKEIEYRKWARAHPTQNDEDEETLKQRRYFWHELSQLKLMREDQEATIARITKQEFDDEFDAALKRGDIPF